MSSLAQSRLRSTARLQSRRMIDTRSPAEESGMALYMASLALFVSSIKGVYGIQEGCGGNL